jgi:hypothetical protein
MSRDPGERRARADRAALAATQSPGAAATSASSLQAVTGFERELGRVVRPDVLGHGVAPPGGNRDELRPTARLTESDAPSRADGSVGARTRTHSDNDARALQPAELGEGRRDPVTTTDER